MKIATLHAHILDHIGNPPGSLPEFSDGSEHAPLMIVGMRRMEGEDKPFTHASRGLVRRVVEGMGLGGDLVRLTDVVKVAGRPPAESIGPWVHFLFEEIAAVKPRAVVLLGLDAANAVFGQSQTNIEEFRRTRFSWPGRTHAVFFVTYDAISGSCDPLLSPMEMYFLRDLQAVVDVDMRHFPKTIQIKG